MTMTTDDTVVRTATTIPPSGILTEEMLARFDERAAGYDRDEHVLRRGLRGAPALGLPAGFRARPTSAAPD